MGSTDVLLQLLQEYVATYCNDLGPVLSNTKHTPRHWQGFIALDLAESLMISFWCIALLSWSVNCCNPFFQLENLSPTNSDCRALAHLTKECSPGRHSQLISCSVGITSNCLLLAFHSWLASHLCCLSSSVSQTCNCASLLIVLDYL